MAILSALVFRVNGAEEWQTVPDGSRMIELPTFLISGSSQAIFDDGKDVGTISLSDSVNSLVARYTTQTDLRPLRYLEERHGKGTHTYRVDGKSLGVLSGFSDDYATIYYSICRVEIDSLRCIHIEYSVADRQRIDAAIPRILKSFRD